MRIMTNVSAAHDSRRLYCHFASYQATASYINSQIIMADKEHEYFLSLAEKSTLGNDDVFMEIIKEFPCIYNRSSAEFKDRSIKLNAWKRIASLHCGEEGAEASIEPFKQHYEWIRTAFSRYLKRNNPPSVSGVNNILINQKFENLQWLINFIKSRSSSTKLGDLGVFLSFK